MATIIQLTKGKQIIVDDADYGWLSQYRWHYVSTGTDCGYARSKIDGKVMYMHRLLTNAPERMQVDHIDLDRLNNQRTNLRLVNASQNQINTAKRSGTSSQYKGVTFDKVVSKWKAAIKLPNTISQKHLGFFINEQDAARAYDDAAFRVFGEYARLNFARARPAPIYHKTIEYDRETHDYKMLLDGELVGFARTYHEAEVTLDQLVFELLSGQYFRERA